jgi:two-component system, NtrC family, sensor histidine kinase PilS
VDDLRKRLTYLMLFRVGLVTLLLSAVAAAELAAPVEETASPLMTALFTLIAFTYGVTILYAVLLRRGVVRGMAAAQIGIDLTTATMLVHLTGGVESVFGFMYLLVLIGAASVLPLRATVIATICAVLLYAFIATGRHLLPLFGQPVGAAGVREIARTIAVYAVAFAATSFLASRLTSQLTRAEARIASQHTRLRDLATLHGDVIRCLTSGLITLTDDDRVVTFNNAAIEMVGLAPEDAVGRGVAEVLPGLAPLLAELPADASIRRDELPHRTPAGADRILGVSVTPLVDAERRTLGRIVNFTDLTELRRMEEVVSRNERLAAVGRLAAGVAHEIRNPLAAISGSIELLQQTAAADRESTELMGIVLREVTRLNTLISELLEFARPRRPDPQRLDVGATVQEMLRVFENDKHLQGARVELSAPQSVWIDADAAQLRQLVWNLLRNAAEATPSGQPISVEVAPDGGDWARITVRDRGPGISPEHRARMFEPFFSTKEGGTGLGLATVHRIVEEHKGRIEVETAHGGGTAFTVRLPLPVEVLAANVPKSGAIQG